MATRNKYIQLKSCVCLANEVIALSGSFVYYAARKCGGLINIFPGTMGLY